MRKVIEYNSPVRMKTFWYLVVFFGILRSTNAVAAANAAPVLQNNAKDYAIISQNLPTGSKLLSLLVTDPENGTLTFSIVGVKYFKNDTLAPKTAYDSTWALTKMPTSGLSTQCSKAESYPFPRNVFCIQPNSNTVKTTSKYSAKIKADFSLFVVTVFVIDNGSPPRNLTTDLYFRVKENCTDSTRDYTNLMQNCPQAREIIRRIGSPSEVGFMFTVPNNSKIARVTVDFGLFQQFKVIEKPVDYTFTYFVGRTKKSSVLTRRLLVNTTLDRKIAMLLWKPVEIIADKENVTLELRVTSGRSDQLYGGGNGIELFLVDRSSDYCANDDCVGLYDVLSQTMSVNGGKPECAREDQFVVVTKYSSCKVINKPPVWVNSTKNFVVMKRNPAVGADIFKIHAKDNLPQKLLFSIIGVTYYANATASPKKVYDQKWAVKSHILSHNLSLCSVAESLPSPRNLFCIEHLQNKIKTTRILAKLRPSYDAMFVIDFIIVDDGKPQLNSTGKVYVSVQNDCPMSATSPCLNQDVHKYTWRSKTEDSYDPSTHSFIFSAMYRRLVDVDIDLTAFDYTGQEKVVRLITKISKMKSSKPLLQKQQYAIFRENVHVNLDRGVAVNGSFVIQFEISAKGSVKPLKRMSNSSSWSPLKIYGITDRDYCNDDDCREFHKMLRSNLTKTHQLECLDTIVASTYNAKYKYCGIVFRGIKVRGTDGSNIQNGTSLFNVKALSNNAVFYSITSVRLWRNDITPAITSRNNSWATKSKKDAEKACLLSESYPFPRNLFCMNSRGFVLATSRLVAKFRTIMSFEIEMAAVDSKNTKEVKKSLQYFVPFFDRMICEIHSKQVLDVYDNCDQSRYNIVAPTKIALNLFYFKAPPLKSLLGLVSIISTLILNAEAGSVLNLTVVRGGKDYRTVVQYILLPPKVRMVNTYVHNISFYDRPVELNPLEEFVIRLEADFPLVLNSSRPFPTMGIFFAPAKNYCLTHCYNKFLNLKKLLPDPYPRFPCLSTSDFKLMNAKYGYCSANTPPALSISNIELTVAPVIGQTIGKIVGTDKEGTKLTYGIIWVHSKALGKNATNPSNFTGKCTEAEKGVAPLSYICVDPNTGEIKVTSKFKHSYGESLRIKVYAIDSGSPRRYTERIFSINIRDPCRAAKNRYQDLSTNCMGANSQYMSARMTGRVVFYDKVGDRVVRLHVDRRLMQFPVDALYTVFTLRQLISQEPTRQYGKKASVVFNNTAYKLQNISIVQLPLKLSFDGVLGAELTATSYLDSSVLPKTTAIPATSTISPVLTNATTATNISAPMASNTTTVPLVDSFTTPGVRKRRQILSSNLVKEQSVISTPAAVNITLVGSSIRLYVQSLKSTCGSTECVKRYQSWVSEAKNTGLSACNEDPLFTHQYFKICLNPPAFDFHPKNINTKQNSVVSLNCTYRNFTGVIFRWIKDGQIFSPPRQAIPEMDIPSESEFTRLDRNSLHTLKSLRIPGNLPELQGYYFCMVKDALNHVVNSSASLVRFTDVSSTRMKLKLRQPFSNALHDKSSAQYKKLSKEVTTAFHSIFDKNGMHKERKIVINGFRPGSVIVDAEVYYLNVTKNTKETICSQLKSLSTADSGTSLQIANVETVSYDCCYKSKTGEENIKGIITWRPVIADSFDRQKCPYGFYDAKMNNTVFKNAYRYCLPNFNDGAQWQTPNISRCAYKTLTTYKLENISQTNISDTNAEQIASELNSITSSEKNITNRLDVKFTADTVENLVKSKKKLSKIANDIVNTTSNMMDFNKTYVAESQIKYKSSSRVLKSLDTLAVEIQISQHTSIKTFSKNVALAIKPIKSIMKDLVVKARRGERSGYSEIDIEESLAKDSQTSKRSSAEISLSRAMLRKADLLQPQSLDRIYSFVFENDRLFLSKKRLEKDLNSSLQHTSLEPSRMINSRILSASIGRIKLWNLTEKEEMQGRFRILSKNPGTIECVFWDFDASDGFGAWSSNGCRPVGIDNSMQKCRCNHLTNFAILLDVSGQGTPKEAALALSIITYIGCGISLLCLLITLITFAVFKNLREKRPPRILICLCIALILTLITFLAGIRAKDLKSCQAVAVLLHYFVLASFLWMAVEGFNLYLSFVKVVNTGITRFMLKSSLFAWGLPVVIVGIAAGATQLDAYGKKNGDDEWLCMVTGMAFYVGYLLPILLIVIANMVIMGFVIRSLRKSTQVSKDRKMTGLTMARICAACSVLMGTTWIVGLFAVDVLTIPMQILFCIFNSLQGFFIFIFYCVRNKDARKQWKKTLGIKSTEDSRSSSAGFQKDRAAKKSTESQKGLMVTKNFYELEKRNNLSSTLTTSVQDSVAEDKNLVLKTFARLETVKNQPIQEDKTVGSFSSESASVDFGIDPVLVEIQVRPGLQYQHTSQDDHL